MLLFEHTESLADVPTLAPSKTFTRSHWEGLSSRRRVSVKPAQRLIERRLGEDAPTCLPGKCTNAPDVSSQGQPRPSVLGRDEETVELVQVRPRRSRLNRAAHLRMPNARAVDLKLPRCTF